MRRAILPLLAAALIAAPGLAEVKKRVRDDVERAGDPADKMICKRSSVIGSLVVTTKECRTRREWDQIRLGVRRIGVSGACNFKDGGIYQPC